LAQGINYLFVQERLDYPFIIDFHLFCESNYGKTYTGSKTPDFVILKEDFSEIGMLESKGEASKTSSITGNSGKLQSALNQLNSIQQFCVHKLIPCCTRLENDKKGGVSSIHYSIRDKICQPKANITTRIFRQHYASWFYLVGDFTIANTLLSNDGFENLEEDDNYNLDEEGQIYWVNRPIIEFDSENDSSFTNFRYQFELWSSRIKIGIYKSVIDSIGRGENQSPRDYPIDSNETYVRFKDGTVIKIGNDNNE